MTRRRALSSHVQNSIFRPRQLTAIIILALSFILSGCRGTSSGDDTGAAPAPPVLAVTAAKATVAPMDSELHLLGTTAATRHVILRAPVAGRVIGMKLKVGDRVRRGEIVARVLSQEIEAARHGLEIARKLDPQEAASLAKSIQRYAGDNHGIAVTALAPGVVAAPPVTSGQMVNYMDPLADLIDPAGIYVEAAVPVQDAAAVRPGMDAIVESPLQPGIAMRARVAAILPSFNTASATSAVRIDFIGPDRLSEIGVPVEAGVITRAVSDAIVIPVAALFEDARHDSYYVFVAGADGRAHRTAVNLGIRGADRVQVSSGLQPGERVITSGGYALSDGLKISLVGDAQ